MGSQTLALTEAINTFSSTQAPTALELGQRHGQREGYCYSCVKSG